MYPSVPPIPGDGAKDPPSASSLLSTRSNPFVPKARLCIDSNGATIYPQSILSTDRFDMNPLLRGQVLTAEHERIEACTVEFSQVARQTDGSTDMHLFLESVHYPPRLSLGELALLLVTFPKFFLSVERPLHFMGHNTLINYRRYTCAKSTLMGSAYENARLLPSSWLCYRVSAS